MSFINPQARRTVQEELLLAAQAIATKHGMTAKIGSSTYDEATYTPKIAFTFPELVKEKTDMVVKRYAPLLGLPEDVIGKSYISKGRTFTVTGLNPSKPKNSVLLERDDGKPFICSPEHLLFWLKHFQPKGKNAHA